MSTTTLAQHMNVLSLDSHDHQADTHRSPPTSGTSSFPSRDRGESLSSLSSLPHSDGRSTPNRPPRSPLRRPLDIMALTDELDSLQVEINGVLDKIYEIEEMRHSATLRSTHASRLDTLLSEIDLSVNSLHPRISAVPASSDPSDVPSLLKKDWARVMAQHALLKQEMLEDPWLIRFRTTAEQAEAMMDPLHSSLVELTGYAGRILSSTTPVSKLATPGRLSIERLRDMTAAHGRLKATYVPSVNRILNMMAKSIADRSVTNGEALRRLNDDMNRWTQLQRQLLQLDGKVALIISQNDPDNPEISHDHEPYEDDNLFMGSPKIPYVPTLEIPSVGSAFSNSLHRVISAGATMNGPPPSSFSALKPPGAGARTGSTTPSAQRTLRRSVSRPNLPTASLSSGDRPRWNVSTKPMRAPSPPRGTPRRTSQASSYAPSTTPSVRRPSTPPMPSPPDVSRIPQRTPMKTPGPRPSNGGIPTPSRPPMHPNRPSMGGGQRMGAATPSKTGARPSMGSRTPSGGRPSVGASATMHHPSGLHRSTLAPQHSHQGRIPPSSWSRSPAPVSASRASSRMSNGGVTMVNVELQPFVPSKYDLLDQEVQKVLDYVKPVFFVARVDQPLRRGQRKGDGEQWTGEYLFGAGSKATPVKLLQLGKRDKVMIRTGGTWQELASYLSAIMEESEAGQEILDDDVF